MPLTFPTHPAAVVPLKVWRPRWFDGVALVVGSVAPDLAYVLDGSGLPVWPFSHQPVGLLGWCLPIVLVATPMIRRCAPAIAANVPTAGVLALPDYGAIAAARHRWLVTGYSGLVGAASHLALDWVEASDSRVDVVGHVLGIVTAATMAVYIGRRRLIRRWYGEPGHRPRRPTLFWITTAAVAVPAVAATPLLPGAFLLHTTGARLLCAFAVALLVAATVVTWTQPAEGPPTMR